MNLKHLLLCAAVAAVPWTLNAGCDEADAELTTAEPADHDDHGDDDDDGHDDHGAESEHVDEVRMTAEAVARYGVQVATVEARPLRASVVAPARVAFNSEAMAHVGSLVAGRVVEINARLGDVVQQGDVLLTVHSPELGQLQGDFLAQRSGADAARPAVELARSSFDRASQLFDDTEGGGVTLNEVQRREADLKVAERAVILADAQISAAVNTLRLHGMTDAQIDRLAESAQVDPTYLVTAPISGSVIEREVTPGELVSPEDESLLVLADTTRLWVLVDVAEAKLGSVGVGSTAHIDVTAVPGRTFEGTVTYVDPRVNDASRTARLRVEVDNADNLLRAGMFARALVGPSDANAETGPVVPVDAVMEVEGEPSVFVPVEGEPNTFARRAVGLGPRVGDFYPVLSGLEVGDEIVDGGTFILKAELGKAGVEHAH